MPRLPKIALLVCDRPNDVVVGLYGDYPRMFAELMQKSLPPNLEQDSASSGVPILDAYDVREAQDYPDENEYDALMITGSAASAYEDVHWINRLVTYITLVATTRPQTKIFGICFGHQIVARALGGDCVPNTAKGWEAGPSNVTLTPLGQKIFQTETEILPINQMHRDVVPELPSSSRWPFHLLGSTPVCQIQGMVLFDTEKEGELADVHILCVQGHPEFRDGVCQNLIEMRKASGVIPANVADAALGIISDRDSRSFIIGRAIWKVLGIP